MIALVTTKAETETGLLPEEISDAVATFDQLIKWKKVAGASNQAEIPEPQPGIDQNFDYANEAVNQIKAELDTCLHEIIQRFKERRICFSHAKMRFEVEIPEEHVRGNKKPRDFEMTSTRQGY